jgi:hypothetical protein
MWLNTALFYTPRTPSAPDEIAGEYEVELAGIWKGKTRIRLQGSLACGITGGYIQNSLAPAI